MLIFEGLGQIAIRYLEWKTPTGIYAEEILSHSEPVLGFGLKKNLRQSMPGGWDVRTNLLGFRMDEELALRKPKGEVRIFVLGGSTVFGWGVEENQSIPGQLQKLIDNRLGKRPSKSVERIRVINAGVPWFNSWHETAMILFRILPLEPDWIIILDGLNDIALGINPTWAPIHMGFVDVPTRIAYERKLAHQDKKSFFIELLKISPTFSYFHTKMKLRESMDVGVYRPELWDQYLHYMNSIQQLTGVRKIGFSVFFQPAICVAYQPSETENRTNWTSLALPGFAETFRKLYTEGEHRFSEQASFKFKSLKLAFEGIQGPFYIDGLHYTPKGNLVLAEKIYAIEIAPNLQKLLN